MPIIAAQHSWKDPDYTPQQAWPDDCRVQWGGRGVVLGKNPYQTAFFEAFPGVGFIRGEGNTIADAEKDAFAQWTRHQGCDGHRWARGSYLNGGGICRKCKKWKMGAFPAVVELGAYKKPIRSMELHIISMGGLAPPHPASVPTTEAKKADALYRRRLALRATYFGLNLPKPPLEPELGLEDTPYMDACDRAVMEFVAREYKRLRSEPDSPSAIEGVFAGLALKRWAEDAVEAGLLEPHEV